MYYIKPFTKSWFINIWYHYKLVIIFTLFVLFLLGIFIHDKATKIHYDYSMHYISDNVAILPEQGGYIDEFEEKLSQAVPDFNGDGKNLAECISIFVSSELAKSDSGAKAEMERAEIAVRAGDSSVFLFGGGYEQAYVGDGIEEPLYDLSEIAEKYGYGEDMVKTYPDGRVYGICMKDNPLLNTDASDIYLVVRPILDTTDEGKEKYASELKMAEYIASGGKYKIEDYKEGGISEE